MFALTDQPIDVSAVIQAVHHPAAGAVVTFIGTVRDHSRGQPVSSLEYETYSAMAEKMLARIGEEVARHWGVRCAIVHRVGTLVPGEVSVVIAVSSPHRFESFKACRDALERLKRDAPVWKKEVTQSGEWWVEGPRGTEDHGLSLAEEEGD